MKSNENLLDRWLTGIDLEQHDYTQEIWEPGFEADRRIVISTLGPYRRVFERPQKFVKRFYHTVYQLPIDDWHLTRKVKLYGGFCTIEAALDIRFQATVKYAIVNSDVLGEMSLHIKTSCQGLIQDIIDKELHNLNGEEWIQTGLEEVEKRINRAINELLMLKNIQSRAISSLTPDFADIEDMEQMDGRFVHESVYLSVLKKQYQFHEKRQREKFRQRDEAEKLKQEHKQKQLQQRLLDDELLRQQQAQDAENIKLRLLEKEKQQNEQHIVEKRIHVENTKHIIQIKELAAEAELQSQEQQQLRKQKSELQLQIDKLTHENLLKEKELQAEIKEFERKQRVWNESKKQLHTEKLKLDKQLKHEELETELEIQELHQIEQQKMQERLQAEKILQESRMKEMALQAEVTEQKKRFDATGQSAEYLRREIELLVLEKQRAELNQTIKNVKHEQDD